MKLIDSMLPQNVSKELIERHGLDLGAEHISKLYDVLFTASANLLNSCKKKDQATALVFSKIDKTVIAVAIVQFFENEDKKQPGNWNLVWSFDEKDIPEGALVININDPQTHPYFTSVSGEKYGFSVKEPYFVDLYVTLLEQLKKWLDENAKATEETLIEQDGVFQARVALENDEKVFAIEPAGEIKMLIKDDASIEK